MGLRVFTSSSLSANTSLQSMYINPPSHWGGGVGWRHFVLHFWKMTPQKLQPIRLNLYMLMPENSTKKTLHFVQETGRGSMNIFTYNEMACLAWSDQASTLGIFQALLISTGIQYGKQIKPRYPMLSFISIPGTWNNCKTLKHWKCMDLSCWVSDYLTVSWMFWVTSCHSTWPIGFPPHLPQLATIPLQPHCTSWYIS